MSQPPKMPGPDVSPRSARSIAAKFFTDLTYLPRWHKGVLAASLASLIIGWLHLGYHAMADSSAPSPAGVQQPAPTTQPAPSALAGWSRRVGASVLLGFLVGWIFRTFLKLMASITALVLGGIVLLSYFNFTNVDLTRAQKEYKDTSSWVTDQAGKLKDSAMGHIHSTLGGALGVFMGVRKKMPAA
jgi:uncharacterized membrane protein (Fun14 family)